MRKDIEYMLKQIPVRRGVILGQLIPSLLTTLLRFHALATGSGIRYMITCTGRLLAVQKAYYAQGRQPRKVINAMRKKLGLYLLGQAEAKRKITWTMKSKHIIKTPTDKSRAFDIVIVDKRGRAKWDSKCDLNLNGLFDYMELADIGRGLGLRCGADFKTPDYPHFESKI